MAVTIISPRFSFVQFSEFDNVQSCQFNDINLCLPVYESSDVSFQFILQTDTEEEADDLATLANDNVTIGITDDCENDLLLTFLGKPERYRISERQLLYLWENLPDFETVINEGQCFIVKIIVDGTYEFCSNCFQRIGDACHTSVIEFGNDENSFGYNYCFSGGEESEISCEPTFVQFTNKENLIIPYTASMQAKYGTMPTVQVWIYDINGDLVDMNIRAGFDTYPPTQLIFDFGGSASGVIKIS